MPVVALTDRLLRQVAESGPYHSTLALIRDVGDRNESLGIGQVETVLHSLNRQKLVAMRTNAAGNITAVWATSQGFAEVGLRKQPATYEVGAKGGHSVHPGDATDYRNQPRSAPAASDLVITKSDNPEEALEEAPEEALEAPTAPAKGKRVVKHPGVYQKRKATLPEAMRLRVLQAVAAHEGMSTQRLGVFSGVGGTNVSMVLSVLAAEGLVKRIGGHSESNRHLVRNYTTDAGKAKLGIATHVTGSVTDAVIPHDVESTPTQPSATLLDLIQQEYPLMWQMWVRKQHADSVLNAAAALEQAGLDDLARQALDAITVEYTALEQEVLRFLDWANTAHEDA